MFFGEEACTIAAQSFWDADVMLFRAWDQFMIPVASTEYRVFICFHKKDGS